MNIEMNGWILKHYYLNIYFVFILSILVGFIEVNINSTYWVLQCKSTYAQSKSVFSEKLTLKALQHPLGTQDALEFLLHLPKEQKINAQTFKIYTHLDQLLNNEETPFKQKVWTLYLLRDFKANRPILRTLWKKAKKGKNLVLGRLAAENLRILKAYDLLEGAHLHPDPEIREHAAHSGANHTSFCSMLKDPWPNVRYAALRGLERFMESSSSSLTPHDSSHLSRSSRFVPSLCILEGLKDPLPLIQLRTAYTLRFLMTHQWDHFLNPEDQQTLLKRVRHEFKQSHHSKDLRTELLHALSLMGDFVMVNRILMTHLEQSGLETYVIASLEALFNSLLSQKKKKKWFKSLCSESDDLQVRLKACILLLRTDLKEKPWLERTYDHRSLKEQELIQKALYTLFPKKFSAPSSFSTHPFDAIKFDPHQPDPLVPPIDQDD